MLRILTLARKNITYRRRQTMAVTLLAMCAMALMIIGGFLGNGIQTALTAAVEPFDMVAGYGGSYQMVLNTVFLQDYPAGNISYRLVTELNNDSRIEQAIPLAFGDNFRGYRIVGTDSTIFSHYARNGDSEPWLRFASGGPFATDSREAVVGNRAAADLGLRIGNTIVSTHGFAHGGEEHASAPYVVCGILESCNGPYDQAIFVDLRSVWAAHGIHCNHDEPIHPEGLRSVSGDGHEEEDHGDHTDCNHVHSDHDGHDERMVTSIMVKPSGFAEAYQLYADFGNRKDADLVFPSQVVIRLLSILGQADWLLKGLGYATGIIAAVTIGLTLYGSVASRTNEALIVRLIGAERRDVVAMFAWEGILSVLPGLVAGCAIGHAALGIVASALERGTSLHAQVGLSAMDGIICILLLGAALTGEVVAALYITRKSV
ncbi:MAG: FtsX-like permease family protein [Planctomycetaceae bacterium]|nr:FtsX-like permease family protein [Planctomycetaceae bacterium]